MDNQPIKVNSSGGFVRLVDYMGDDNSPAQAARVSYAEGTKTVTQDKELTRFLMRHEHFSPFAMAQVKLHMRFPIYIHNQMVRHDRFHWNLMSGRYSVMPNEKWMPLQEEIRGQGSGNKQVGNGQLSEEEVERAVAIFNTANTDAQDAYDSLLSIGVCREQARTALPLGQYSEGYATANLGDWLLFLKQRLAPGAQAEIREYAVVIRDILYTLFPTVIQAWEDYQLNAVTFSAQEMQVLKEWLHNSMINEYRWEDPDEEDCNSVDLLNLSPGARQQWLAPIATKRERIEFWNKIKQ